MHPTSQNRVCKLHQLECIAIDINHGTDNRHYCLKCLDQIKIRNSMSYPEAENQLMNAKKAFKTQVEISIKDNKALLSQVLSEMQIKKNQIDEHFQKLVFNITNQINLYDDSQANIENKLPHMDLDQYLSTNNDFTQDSFKNDVFLKKCEELFELITRVEDFDPILTNLQRLNITQITLQPSSPQQIDSTKKKVILSFRCLVHDSDMIMYDENKSIEKDARLICDECLEGRIGPFKSLPNIFKSWEEQKQLQIQELNNYQNQKIQKMQSVINHYDLFKQKMKECINESQKLLKSNLSKQTSITQEKILYWEKFQSSLTKSQVLAIAEYVTQQSKRDLYQQEIQRIKKQHDTQLEEIISKSILQTQETFSYIQKIKELIFPNQKNNQNLLNETRMAQQLSDSKDSTINYNSSNQQIQQKFQQCKNIINLAVMYQNQVSNIQYVQQAANFQITNNNKIKQQKMSFAMAFNNDSTLLIAGCDKGIKIFEFTDGKLDLKQFLQDQQTSAICFLYFLKRINQFIAGQENGQLRVYVINKHQKWCCTQLLKDGHSDWIMQIIMNKDEDVMITCSQDCQIMFWQRTQKTWRLQSTLSFHTSYVFSISLNESETKLVSCGQDKQIIIYKQKSEQQWWPIQNITTNQYGNRVCFIGENQIAFQYCSAQYLLILQYESSSQRFIRFQDVKVNNNSIGCENWFPLIYNSNKQILVDKNGLAVNIIRKNNNQYILDQTIQFQTNKLWGTLSQDGIFLITWDAVDQEFQVRKFQ